MGPTRSSTRPQRGFPWRKLIVGGAATIAISSLACASFVICLPAWLRFGVVVDSCPAGRPVQTARIEASDLRRGVWSEVDLTAIAHYTTGPADQSLGTSLRPARDIALSLVDSDGKVEALQPRKGWKRGPGRSRSGEIRLPADLPDGDYLLRARVHTRLGDSTVDAALPLYAPARVHVLTDRPLYEPGNTIQARSLQLRAADLTPLGGRPGTWTVEDPQGTVLFEEQLDADDWGVAALRFPLDRQAPAGDWTIRWTSGEDGGQATVRVEPFTLPRFSVETTAGRPFYRSGEVPTVQGRVTYASGAPVGDARLEIAWSSKGAWPLPTSWQAGDLPTQATTDDSGSFSLQLPVVPADLVAQATLHGRILATDPAGDVVTGAVAVLLSQDAIDVDAVTELSEGLVEGFNNRVYLRATTASGSPLADTDLIVRRAWDPGDEGVHARTDTDGVAALQLDPGPAVNIVIPPMPVRPPPPVVPVRVGALRDLLGKQNARLVDQRAVQGAEDDLAACARFAESSPVEVKIMLRISGSGRVMAYPADQPLDRCLAARLGQLKLPAGPERFYEAGLQIDDSDLADVPFSSQAWPEEPREIRDALQTAALDARGCVPLAPPAASRVDTGSSSLPAALQWRRARGAHRVEVSWLPVGGSRLDAELVRCLQGRLAALDLPATAVASTDQLGIVRYSLRPSARMAAAAPQPTTMLGYELTVTALGASGDAIGDTTLRLPPGQVPPVRLRADPILATAGGPVDIELLRGPDFRGELPDKLTMVHQDGSAMRAELDEDSHVARFTLPADKDGWYTVAWGGGEARVFVRPRGELAVTVTPDADRHAPGDSAVLRIRTTAGDAPTQAAVALVGVDDSLAQLVPLPGPDSLDSLRDPVQTAAPAFGSLDGQALSLGRIRGDNAAAAVVLRVSQLPVPADRDRSVWVDSGADFDPITPLTDRFYVALAALHRATRQWEEQAATDVHMDNATMARLWDDALADCDAAGQPIEDAYGRRLKLAWLPDDLLQLTDPRAVVVDGTHLPEDVDPWIPWVRKERP